MATVGTQKVRRIVAKLNKVIERPAVWLTADALKTLCQEIEAQDNRIQALETEVARLGSPSRDLIGPGPNQPLFDNIAPSHLDNLFGPTISVPKPE